MPRNRRRRNAEFSRKILALRSGGFGTTSMAASEEVGRKKDAVDLYRIVDLTRSLNY